jgi:hypothetical protein
MLAVFNGLDMTSYRVSLVLMLEIADHCDRATLRAMMQTCKVSIYAMVTQLI